MDVMLEAEVHFYSSEQGGRKGVVPATPFVYKAPVEIEGRFYDCGMQSDAPLAPGDTGTVRMEFLSPHLLRDKLRIGATFKIWQLGYVGEGKITTLSP